MTIPDSDVDFYGRPAIRDPSSVYRPLLDQAPIVRLRKHGVLAVARYEELRSMLKAHGDFISSKGVTMNPFLNKQSQAATSTPVLVSDGERHARLRRHLIAPMRPRALEDLRKRIERSAEEKVASLVGRGTFEAMEDLASHLPVTIVAEMVGLRGTKRARMVGWSKATFNLIGPMNARAIRSLPAVLSMLRFQRHLQKDDVVPGTWVHRLFALRDEGLITHHDVLGMVIDYVAPSLDTTIFATGHLLHRLARHREQWQALKGDPALVADAVSESLRIDSVVRAFTRVAARDLEFAGAAIEAGQRILVVYGAGNRDERQYPDPDRFDITRDARDHLAFGHGVHACAGTRLARLEMEALLRALVEQVDHIEVGTPRIANNNTLHGFDRLPIGLVAS